MSGPQVAARRPFQVGVPVVVEALGPDRSLAAVFEDDGSTGYFYALDRTLVTEPVVDAVCIYDVDEFEAGQGPSLLHIVWSADGSKVALLIDEHPQAVFDFEEKRGYCRSGFPEPGPEHGWTRRDWDDSLREAFFGG